MIYGNIRKGIFRNRPNRFIALVEVDGRLERCHVKNTGRCKELLAPGAEVFLHRPGTPGRATEYDLVAVWKGSRLVNMDSQAPNKVFLEYLRSGQHLSGVTLLKPETKYGGSRFDFYVETGQSKYYIEVKGVTLEENGTALFPDAPTERGIKHLRELTRWVREGYRGQVVFVIQMEGVRCFQPNQATHPAFGAALATAAAAGVEVFALDCKVIPAGICLNRPVPVKLEIQP